MPTRRYIMTVEHLADFKAFCVGKGWQEIPTKGQYEILRMSPADGSEPLMIYKKAKPLSPTLSHYTSYGIGAELLTEFLQELIAQGTIK